MKSIKKRIAMHKFFSQIQNELLMEITKSILSDDFDSAIYYTNVLRDFKNGI